MRQLDVTNWSELPDSTQLTIAEVAEILRVSQSHIRNAITSGLLEARCFKGRGRGIYRIEKRSVLLYQKSSTVLPAVKRRKRTSQSAAGQCFKHLSAEKLLEAWRRGDA